jgi:hypothetical protein
MHPRTQNNSVLRQLLCCLTLFIVAPMAGCTSEFGNRILNSRYVYEEYSKVTPQGNVAAAAENTGFMTCGFTREDYEAVYDEALAQAPDANVLLNYYVTSETTLLPIIPVCFNKLTVSGLAATAEVR